MGFGWCFVVILSGLGRLGFDFACVTFHCYSVIQAIRGSVSSRVVVQRPGLVWLEVVFHLIAFGGSRRSSLSFVLSGVSSPISMNGGRLGFDFV